MRDDCTIDQDGLRKKKSEAQSIRPTLRVGKEGLTPEVAEELRRQIKVKGLVKVRLNPSYGTETAKAADRLAEASCSDVVDVRGRTVVLCRR